MTISRPGMWIGASLSEELHNRDLDAWAVSCQRYPENPDSVLTTLLGAGYISGYKAAIADARRIFDALEKTKTETS